MPFGTWGNPVSSYYIVFDTARFQSYSILLIIASLVLALIYKIGPTRYFGSFVKGCKDYLVAALITGFAYTLFFLVANYPVYNTIATWILGLSKKFNVALGGLFSLISAPLYIDINYTGYFVAGALQQLASDAHALTLTNVMITNMYGLAMLIAPTSIILLTSLSITDVSYKDWLKYIWKLFLALFVVSFVVLMIVYLI